MALEQNGENIYTGEMENKLKQECIQVMDQEQRLSLLLSLKCKGLSTRDILAFIKNQADLRTILKRLDRGTLSLAMESKIRDCKAVLRHHRKERARVTQEFLKSTGGNKKLLRRTLKRIKQENEARLQSRKRKNDKKN